MILDFKKSFKLRKNCGIILNVGGSVNIVNFSQYLCSCFQIGRFFIMFNIGDRVVYPMHGAGVIESIEEREILGQKQKYYIMKMPVGDIQVMVPTNNAQEVGMREVIQCKDADRVLNVLSGERTEMNANWNKRYRENMDKIKSGNIFEVAEVVKNLAYKNNEKGLSAGEKKLYNSAKQILISELVLANQASKDEIESLVEEKLNLHEN